MPKCPRCGGFKKTSEKHYGDRVYFSYPCKMCNGTGIIKTRLELAKENAEMLRN